MNQQMEFLFAMDKLSLGRMFVSVLDVLNNLERQIKSLNDG